MKKNQINILNIIIATELIVLAVCLVLSATGIIPVKLKIFWLPMLLGFFGIVLFSIAIMKKDRFAAWFCVPFLLSVIILLIAEICSVKYSLLYPLFTALPGIASLILLPFVKLKVPHVKSAVIFIGISLIFLLDVLLHLNWGIIVSVIIGIAGILLLINTLIFNKNDWEKTKDKKGHK